MNISKYADTKNHQFSTCKISTHLINKYLNQIQLRFVRAIFKESMKLIKK